MKSLTPVTADVERGPPGLKPRFHGSEAAADRDLARREAVVGEAVILADVGRVAEIPLAVDRDEDVVLDERANVLVGREELAADPDVDVIDSGLPREATALGIRVTEVPGRATSVGAITSPVLSSE